MSRRVTLPTDDDVTAALNALLADAAAQGVRPTVLALASRLGVSNTTFWRRFPDTARQVRAAAGAVADAADPDAGVDTLTASGGPDRAGGSGAQRLAALSRENQQLHEQLELACAHIARLTLTNQGLVEELEAVTSVTPLFLPRRSSTNSSST